MKSIFEKHRLNLLASNVLWIEVTKLKDLASEKQAQAANLIKEVYSDFHKHIVDRCGLQGQVNLKLSDDGRSIIGLELGFPESSGLRKETLLLGDKHEDKNIAND